MRPLRFSRLAVKVLLLILGASLLQMLLSGLVTQRTLHGDIQSLLIEQRQRINSNAVQLIERELAIRKQFLTSIAAQLSLDNTVSYDASRRVLESQQATISELFPSGVVTHNAKGIAVGESIRVEGRLGTRYADSPHIQQALNSVVPVISQPIIGRTMRTPIISITVPVINATGTVIGLVSGVIQLERENLFDAAVNLTLGIPSRLYVMDIEHQIYVTSTDPDLALKPLPSSEMNPLLAALRRGESMGQLSNIETGGDDFFVANEIPDLGWRVVSVTPLKLVTEKLNPILQQNLMIGVIFFLVLSAALIWLLGRTMQPLSEAAQQITEMMDGSRPIQPIQVDNEDEVGHLVSAFNQLSNRQLNQALELEQERDALRSQFEQSSDAIVLLNVDSLCIVRANPQASRLLGYSLETLCGQYLAELMSDGQPPLAELLEEATAEDGHCVIALIRQFGGKVDCEVTAANVGSRGKRKLMLNLRDISERLRNEQLKNDFISTVSHELRTPLTGIYGTLRLINSGTLDSKSEQAEKMLQVAEYSSQQLTTLINDLLDIDKLEAGKLNLDIMPLALDEQLHMAQRQLSPLVDAAGVSLRLPERNGYCVMADAQRLQQVIANLLSNAIKFSPRGAVISIDVEREEQHIQFCVTDQGEGIPLAFQKNIFNRFAQADSTSTRQRGGTGLGLAISRSLVRAMNGHIGFSSTPGQGSSFWVSLPEGVPATGQSRSHLNTPDSNGTKAYD